MSNDTTRVRTMDNSVPQRDISNLKVVDKNIDPIAFATEDSMQTSSKSRPDVDSGEEMLLIDFSTIPNINSNATLDFYCGIDCGSTQTRICLVPPRVVDEEEDLGAWFKHKISIPSLSRTTSLDKRFRPRNNLLFDNMDSVFSVNGNSEVRLLRGLRLLDVEAQNNELISTTKKIKSEVLLYNIADAIGYSVVHYCIEHQQPLPAQVNLNIGLALPPEDLLSDDARELGGKLRSIVWKLSAKSPAIKVKVHDLKIYSEPEAQLRAHCVLDGDETNGGWFSEAILLEVGGRNGAASLMIDGAVLQTQEGYKSLDQSGSQLMDKIGLAYEQKYGVKKPHARHLKAALRSGKVPSGSTERDIVDIIKVCKDEVAADLFQKLLTEIISKQSALSLETTERIMLSGRFFDAGTYNYSISVPFAKHVHNISPNTKVIRAGTNLIPEGLVLLYLSETVLLDSEE